MFSDMKQSVSKYNSNDKKRKYIIQHENIYLFYCGLPK